MRRGRCSEGSQEPTESLALPVCLSVLCVHWQWGRDPTLEQEGWPVSPTSHPSLQIIRKALSEEKRVSTKTSAADLVTETDHVVEALILQELQTRFPSHR